MRKGRSSGLSSSKLFPLVSGNIVSVTTAPRTLTAAAAASAAIRPFHAIKIGNRKTPKKAPSLPAAAANPCPVVRARTGKIRTR